MMSFRGQASWAKIMSAGGQANSTSVPPDLISKQSGVTNLSLYKQLPYLIKNNCNRPGRIELSGIVCQTLEIVLSRRLLRSKNVKISSIYFWEMCFLTTPRGRKRAYTQTTAVVPAEPDTPWRVSHLSFIHAKCWLTSVFKWEVLYPTW